MQVFGKNYMENLMTSFTLSKNVLASPFNILNIFIFNFEFTVLTTYILELHISSFELQAYSFNKYPPKSIKLRLV